MSKCLQCYIWRPNTFLIALRQSSTNVARQPDEIIRYHLLSCSKLQVKLFGNTKANIIVIEQVHASVGVFIDGDVDKKYKYHQILLYTRKDYNGIIVISKCIKVANGQIIIIMQWNELFNFMSALQSLQSTDVREIKYSACLTKYINVLVSIKCTCT